MLVGAFALELLGTLMISALLASGLTVALSILRHVGSCDDGEGGWRECEGQNPDGVKVVPHAIWITTQKVIMAYKNFDLKPSRIEFGATSTLLVLLDKCDHAADATSDLGTKLTCTFFHQLLTVSWLPERPQRRG